MFLCFLDTALAWRHQQTPVLFPVSSLPDPAFPQGFSLPGKWLDWPNRKRLAPLGRCWAFLIFCNGQLCPAAYNSPIMHICHKLGDSFSIPQTRISAPIPLQPETPGATIRLSLGETFPHLLKLNNHDFSFILFPSKRRQAARHSFVACLSFSRVSGFSKKTQ